MTDGEEMGADLSVVTWEEHGKAPGNVAAKARGAGADLVNTGRFASLSANHTRPLFPLELGTCNGSGDAESAISFRCK